MSATILYLNTTPTERIPQMTLAGIRRYATAREWTAEAFSPEASRAEAIPALIAAHAPVVGCVYECSDDNVPASPEIFGGLPVVYLHAAPSLRGDRFIRLSTDNAAVANAAFRELSANRPAGFAVVGVPESFGWSVARERTFAALVAKAGGACAVFTPRDELPATRADRLAAFLAALPRRTAVFAVNDLVAAEVIAAARAAHRAIPRELTLLGVDNLPAICETSHPTISSIQIDFERAGFVSARLLAEAIKGRVSPPSAADGPAVGPLMAVRRESTGGYGRREPFVLQAMERIRHEACDGLTARDVIAAAPVSRSLFILRFREAVGHSVQDEIEHVRLERVFTLLRDTDTPISAIAAFCGWRSDIALRWLFRRRTGMSMREWRRKNT
jgi:LacI family transcriptional regulator